MNLIPKDAIGDKQEDFKRILESQKELKLDLLD
mgnify:CR=1 FL=1